MWKEVGIIEMEVMIMEIGEGGQDNGKEVKITWKEGGIIEKEVRMSG